MPKRQRVDDDSGAAPPPEIATLLSWLTGRGAVGVERLRVRPSAATGGGLGVFAHEPILPGGTIVQVPQRCVLTTRKVWESEVGRCCRELCCADGAFGALCDGAFVMFLWMALGRADAAHPFHVYLASLPAEAPNCECWAPEKRALLRGTNLGAAAERAREKLDAQHAALLPALAAARPDLFGQPGGGGGGGGGGGYLGGGLEGVRWARGMYTSRAYPASLCPELAEPAAAAGGDGGAATGVMLPLFDIMNHRCPLLRAWGGDEQFVTFSHTEESTLLAGEEVGAVLVPVMCCAVTSLVPAVDPALSGLQQLRRQGQRGADHGLRLRAARERARRLRSVARILHTRSGTRSPGGGG